LYFHYIFPPLPFDLSKYVLTFDRLLGSFPSDAFLAAKESPGSPVELRNAPFFPPPPLLLALLFWFHQEKASSYFMLSSSFTQMMMVS